MILRVTEAEYLGDCKLRLRFNNGAQGVVDLEAELYGDVFEPLRDKEVFTRFVLTSRTVEWPNGADFAPEFLFLAAGMDAKRRETHRTSSSLITTASPVLAGAALREPSETYQVVVSETEES
jgi:hypothetical protein